MLDAPYSSPIHVIKRKVRVFCKPESEDSLDGVTEMGKMIAAISLSAVIALAPFAATAETLLLAQAAPADTTGAAPAASPAPATGTHRARTRSKAHQRARASAKHMSAPATPAAPAPQ
jgi:hypothetical protein